MLHYRFVVVPNLRGMVEIPIADRTDPVVRESGSARILLHHSDYYHFAPRSAGPEWPSEVLEAVANHTNQNFHHRSLVEGETCEYPFVISVVCHCHLQKIKSKKKKAVRRHEVPPVAPRHRVVRLLRPCRHRARVATRSRREPRSRPGHLVWYECRAHSSSRDDGFAAAVGIRRGKSKLHTAMLVPESWEEDGYERTHPGDQCNKVESKKKTKSLFGDVVVRS